MLKKNGTTFSTIMERFHMLFEDVMMLRNDLFIIGDFNIYVDDNQRTNAR